MSKRSLAQTSWSRHAVISAALFLSVAAPGCSGNPLLSPNDIVSIGFAQTAWVLFFGEPQVVTAFPRDAGGRTVEIVGNPLWELSNPAVATLNVDPVNGLSATITLQGVGESMISVTIGGVTGQFLARGTDMEGCQRDRAIVGLLSSLLLDPFHCLFSSSAVYRGIVEHSATLLGSQAQKDDHTSFGGYGGQIVSGGMVPLFEQVLAACNLSPSGSRAAPSPIGASVPSSGRRGAQCVAVRGNGPAPADNEQFIALNTWMRQRIPQVPDKPLEFALALDWDKNPLNNFIPHPDFQDDHAQNSDLLFKVSYSFQTNEWEMSAFDLSTSNGVPAAPREIETSVQAIIDGADILWFVPGWTGDNDGPEFRITSFEHDGGFGISLGSQWAAGYHPNLGQMALLPQYEY